MRDEPAQSFDQAILDWYDVHARELPWRIGPEASVTGQRQDPYRVWLSEIMLQQTTVAAVQSYFLRFVSLWPTVEKLAAAADETVMGEWAGLGYYARARNLLKCARVVTDIHGGVFPDNYDELVKLPGIGPYTAAAIAAIAFDRPDTVMDGNVERVMARFFDEHAPLPQVKPVLKAHAARLTSVARPGDYAQAVMDLGATICTPKSPACGVCPVCEPCLARRAGTARLLPAKLPKKPKPTRHGFAYLARRADDAYVLERRPDKGLLGGMLCWPGSDWSDAPSEAPPFAAEWTGLPGEVRHTFTHFHLILQLRTAQVPATCHPEGTVIVPSRQFRPSDLPTVMRKAYDLWRAH
ncbi:MAG: A/G-specific adenine glycosylase [Pseudomonadota bacterium]